MGDNKYSKVRIRETDEVKQVRIASDLKPEPGSEIIEKWQSLLDLQPKL